LLNSLAIITGLFQFVKGAFCNFPRMNIRIPGRFCPGILSPIGAVEILCSADRGDGIDFGDIRKHHPPGAQIMFGIIGGI